MANKMTLDSLNRPSLPILHGTKDREGQAASGHIGKVDADDLDERFREAIQRGDTSGDVVFLDEQGNEIKNVLSSKTITDL